MYNASFFFLYGDKLTVFGLPLINGKTIMQQDTDTLI